MFLCINLSVSDPNTTSSIYSTRCQRSLIRYRSRVLDQGTDVKVFRPFVYIDVSYAPLLFLHVQPLPETYNVTKYRIWLVNNDTNTVTFADIFSTTSKQDIRYNFTAHTGVFYFKVSPVHTYCGEYGCANSTTPYIIIRKQTAIN